MGRALRVGSRWQCAFAVLCLAGCHLFNNLNPVAPSANERADKAPVPPGKKSFRQSQFVFLYDFDLKRDQPLFEELATLRDQVYKELELPSSNTLVQVYIFEDRDHYERFMHSKYPDLPKRRAFFVAQPRTVGGAEDLLVYTYWGERVKEDLRHECTHAILHSVLKDVPLWLDEGLAEYFEVPREWLGVNYHHLEIIRRGPGGPFTPDLARLEQLSQVQQMSPAEYREAWAWVHLMLRGSSEGRPVLLAYLQQLRANPNPGPLQPQLVAVVGSINRTLEKHIAQLDAAPRPVSTAQR
jgi:hypothetical protein